MLEMICPNCKIKRIVEKVTRRETRFWDANIPVIIDDRIFWSGGTPVTIDIEVFVCRTCKIAFEDTNMKEQNNQKFITAYKDLWLVKFLAILFGALTAYYVIAVLSILISLFYKDLPLSLP